MLSNRETRFILACFAQGHGSEFNWRTAGAAADFTGDEAYDLAVALTNKNLLDGMCHGKDTAVFESQGRELARALIEEEDKKKRNRHGITIIDPSKGGEQLSSARVSPPAAASIQQFHPLVSVAERPTQPEPMTCRATTAVLRACGLWLKKAWGWVWKTTDHALIATLIGIVVVVILACLGHKYAMPWLKS